MLSVARTINVALHALAGWSCFLPCLPAACRGAHVSLPACLPVWPRFPQPANFEFYDPTSPIYTSPRVLPPASITHCKVGRGAVYRAVYRAALRCGGGGGHAARCMQPRRA